MDSESRASGEPGAVHTFDYAAPDTEFCRLVDTAEGEVGAFVAGTGSYGGLPVNHAFVRWVFNWVRTGPTGDLRGEVTLRFELPPVFGANAGVIKHTVRSVAGFAPVTEPTCEEPATTTWHMEALQTMETGLPVPVPPPPVGFRQSSAS